MKSFAVVALAVIFAPAALAQHRTFAINPDASEIKMTLNTTHEVVNGTFHIQSGSIEFDRGNPKMSGSVTVLAGSGKTGNDSRDKKMNKDILKVDQYTSVSFAPKTYTGTIAPSGDSTIQVSGVFRHPCMRQSLHPSGSGSVLLVGTGRLLPRMWQRFRLRPM